MSDHPTPQAFADETHDQGRLIVQSLITLGYCREHAIEIVAEAAMATLEPNPLRAKPNLDALEKATSVLIAANIAAKESVRLP
jgi:hypothetical protein